MMSALRYRQNKLKASPLWVPYLTQQSIYLSPLFHCILRHQLCIGALIPSHQVCFGNVVFVPRPDPGSVLAPELQLRVRIGKQDSCDPTPPRAPAQLTGVNKSP